MQGSILSYNGWSSRDMRSEGANPHCDLWEPSYCLSIPFPPSNVEKHGDRGRERGEGRASF